MSELATTVPGRPPAAALLDKKMKKSHAMISGGVVIAALVIGLGFIAVHLVQDLSGVTVGSAWPWVLLVVALLIALGFEFVNGFHDTANAVATVIYTHSLEPNMAVVWSGFCNLVGVLTSTGTVAFTVITLLPVELILQVSSGAGFAMVFALLIAAITLEPQHLVVWPARLQLSYHGRLHHRRRSGEPADERTQRHFRRRRRTGHQGLQGSAHLSNRWLCRRRLVVPAFQVAHQISGPL